MNAIEKLVKSLRFILDHTDEKYRTGHDLHYHQVLDSLDAKQPQASLADDDPRNIQRLLLKQYSEAKLQLSMLEVKVVILRLVNGELILLGLEEALEFHPGSLAYGTQFGSKDSSHRQRIDGKMFPKIEHFLKAIEEKEPGSNDAVISFDSWKKWANDPIISGRVQVLNRIQVETSTDTITLDNKAYAVTTDAARLFAIIRDQWPTRVVVSNHGIRMDRLSLPHALTSILEKFSNGVSIKLTNPCHKMD